MRTYLENVLEIEFRFLNENKTKNIQDEGMNFIIPSNFMDKCIRLEILLGLKLSGHSDTLTETSNLKHEL